MKQLVIILFGVAMSFMVTVADEIKKESDIKTRGTTNIETDTYFQSGDRVLEVKKIINLSDDSHMIQQKIMWNDSVVVEFDVSHMNHNFGQFMHFHSVPGVNAVTSAKSNGMLQSISLVTTNLTVLRSFNVAEGLLSPVPIAETERRNTLRGKVKNIFHDFQCGDASGGEFLDRATGILKEYNKEDGSLSSEAEASRASGSGIGGGSRGQP